MRYRKALTILWGACFLLALAILEAYFWHDMTVGGQHAPIATGSHLPFIQQILAIYGPPLATIGAFWFGKPFPALASDHQATFRFRIALAAAIVFNAAALYLIARYHFDPAGLLADALADARNTALALDILIVPANAYYFGTRGQEGAVQAQ